MLAALAFALYILLPSGERKHAQSDNSLIYFADKASADVTSCDSSSDSDSATCDGCDSCDGS